MAQQGKAGAGRPSADGKWLQVESGEWAVAYRAVRKDGILVIAEVRVFPREDSAPVATWSGRGEAVPERGITAEIIRLVKLNDARVRLLSQLQAERLSWREKEATELAQEAAAHPRRAGRPDGFYARLARLYVEEVSAANPRPSATLARLLNRSPSYVREALRIARQRRLLERPEKGRRAGGELTAKARRLLSEPEGA